MKVIAHDKALHLVAGTWAAFAGLVVGRALAGWLGWPPRDAEAAAIGCACAAVAREGYNLARGGLFDPIDLAATLVGGAPVIGAAASVQA